MTIYVLYRGTQTRAEEFIGAYKTKAEAEDARLDYGIDNVDQYSEKVRGLRIRAVTI